MGRNCWNSTALAHLMFLECNKNPSRWIKDDERGEPNKCPVKYLVDLIMWTHSVCVCVCGGDWDGDEVREKRKGKQNH